MSSTVVTGSMHEATKGTEHDEEQPVPAITESLLVRKVVRLRSQPDPQLPSPSP